MHTQKKFALIDFDGPISTWIPDDISHAIDDENFIDIVKEKNGFYFEIKVNERIQHCFTIYINNLPLIKTVLDILHENEIILILASQRTIHGHMPTHMLNRLAIINQGKKLTLTDEEIKYLLTFDNNLLWKNINTFNQDEKVKLNEVKDKLSATAHDENQVRKGFYQGLDLAFGLQRDFFIKDITEAVAFKVATEYPHGATDFNKSIFLEETLAILNEHMPLPENKVLLDDGKIYGELFDGVFIRVKRDFANGLNDSLYLIELLMAFLPEDKIIETLNNKALLPDTANKLKLLFLYQLNALQKNELCKVALSQFLNDNDSVEMIKTEYSNDYFKNFNEENLKNIFMAIIQFYSKDLNFDNRYLFQEKVSGLVNICSDIDILKNIKEFVTTDRKYTSLIDQSFNRSSAEKVDYLKVFSDHIEAKIQSLTEKNILANQNIKKITGVKKFINLFKGSSNSPPLSPKNLQVSSEDTKCSSLNSSSSSHSSSIPSSASSHSPYNSK